MTGFMVFSKSFKMFYIVIENYVKEYKYYYCRYLTIKHIHKKFNFFLKINFRTLGNDKRHNFVLEDIKNYFLHTKC